MEKITAEVQFKNAGGLFFGSFWAGLIMAFFAGIEAGWFTFIALVVFSVIIFIHAIYLSFSSNGRPRRNRRRY